MSFWSTSAGEDLSKTSAPKDYAPDAGGTPIPDNSTVKAYLKKAEWKNVYEGDEKYINLHWVVEAPESLKGRNTFTKLWAGEDFDPNTLNGEDGQKKALVKRDKARRFFHKIDAEAGGKLAARGEDPTDDSMALCLTNKPMVVTFGLWEINGNSGNFLKGVHEANKELKAGKDSPPAGGGFGGGSDYDDLDDSDIPF